MISSSWRNGNAAGLHPAVPGSTPGEDTDDVAKSARQVGVTHPSTRDVQATRRHYQVWESHVQVSSSMRSQGIGVLVNDILGTNFLSHFPE